MSVEILDLVLLAGGQGTRTGRQLPKQFLELKGKPMLLHPLAVFDQMPQIGQKIIVHEPSQRDRVGALLEQYGIRNCVLTAGGNTRQESVRRGIERVQTARVVLHNAVVALVTRKLIENVIAVNCDCVTTGTELQDNLVRGGEFALEPVNRKELRIINSPQSFRTAVLRECHARALQEGVQTNSDCELMLKYHRQVRLVPGTFRNFKITTELDLALAETLLEHPELCPD
jgi:2-C-methyl-D-erythritol 4-phosphate cytidylyltransferase